MIETITLHLTDYLDKAFKTIPSNSFIHKGRCGIGGTTLEIKAPRCSIIVVPTRGVITHKHNSHPELFRVKGGVTTEKIAEYLASNVLNKKIMTTPDSFDRIISAAISIGKLDELYKKYFLLMDECHSAITEVFREKILTPFKYLWNFRNKAFISATPIEFSDKRFKELKHIHIKFHEPYIGKVIVKNTACIDECVDYYISNRDLFEGKLFFEYNSVTEIAETIRRNKLPPGVAHIYCADKEENFDKLPENLLMFQQEPVDGKYAPINFFTSKYFEGVDINEHNATVLLVTDVNKAHTKVGITNKGVQAVGRVRFTPAQIIHITNNRNKQGMKTLNEFRKDYEIHTNLLIGQYNNYIAECKVKGIEPIDNAAKLIERFVEIDEDTKQAILEPNKLDQVLNELACNEQFNSIDTIVEAWEKSLFQVEQQPFLRTGKSKKRKSKADKLKELIELIEDLNLNKNKYVMGFAARELEKVQKESPLALESYYHLGKDKLAALDYNQKAIEVAMIEKHNENAEPKLLAYLDTKINIGDRKTIEELISILQYGYNLYQIRNPKTGKVKIANARQLGEIGRYKIDDCKININGSQVNGFTIVKKYFNVSIAA